MIQNVASSFRDPSGFLFWHDNTLYRAIRKHGKHNFTRLHDSGLYQTLTQEKSLIPHELISATPSDVKIDDCIVIQPQKIPFISYPYEWSFSQLKDAALLTLHIQKTALDHGMSLKDASAYNVQFFNGKPIFIDTLSFETYHSGKPWAAYKQFCQHFLAPLTLMAYTDIRLNTLYKNFIDGIPLDLAAKLLPTKTKFKPSLYLHLHLHAKTLKKYETAETNSSKKQHFGLTAFKGLIDNLESCIKKLEWKPSGTEWAEYYQDDSYTNKAFQHKKEIVSFLIEQVQPKTVWDLGANDGTFSRLAAKKQANLVYAFDIDHACVEQNYLQLKKRKETKIMPLLLDLSNPSPAIGWNNAERESFIKRGPTDVILALALIHHLTISNNVPLHNVAHMFRSITKNLIIEFVPKSDKKVQFLLRSRKDIFDQYSQEIFEATFTKYFTLKEKIPIQDSQRCLYLFCS